ncbi:MAG: hypothetical protein MRJ68_00765 [Nitrospira sp.]|nr:hypothetical protein [Nitrospira sp.]
MWPAIPYSANVSKRIATATYSGKTWNLRTALDLRRQQLKEFVERGTVNLKHSPGGIVDIEYAIQYLQIMHGHRLAILRNS